MDSEALHSSARRYLMDRYEELTRAHGDGRTREAKRLVPRYNAVDAVLVEVERLDADRLPAPDALAAALG